METPTVPDLESQASQPQFIDTFSTGGFTVPDVPEQITMNLYFSSQSVQEASIGFQVNRFTGITKQRVIEASVAIPPQGAAAIGLDLDELDLTGKTIEVVLERPLLPDFQVHPSASIVTTGQEGAVIPVRFLATGDFDLAKEEQASTASTPQGQAVAQGSHLFPTR